MDDATRRTCTAETPWIGGRVVHPDAVLLRQDHHDGSWTCDVYRCPHCNTEFHVELPD